MDHFFICLVTIYILFDELSVKLLMSLLIFFIALYVFLLLNFKSSLCVLDNSPLSDYFCKYLFQSVAYLLILLKFSFTELIEYLFCES